MKLEILVRESSSGGWLWEVVEGKQKKTVKSGSAKSELEACTAATKAKTQLDAKKE